MLFLSYGVVLIICKNSDKNTVEIFGKKLKPFNFLTFAG